MPKDGSLTALCCDELAKRRGSGAIKGFGELGNPAGTQCSFCPPTPAHCHTHARQAEEAQQRHSRQIVHAWSCFPSNTVSPYTHLYTSPTHNNSQQSWKNTYLNCTKSRRHFQSFNKLKMILLSSEEPILFLVNHYKNYY